MIVLLGAALVAAACGTSSPSSGATERTPGPTSAATVAPATIEPSVEPLQTEPPASTNPETPAPATDTPATPGPEPEPEPSEPAPTGSASTAEACTGTDGNRDFYAEVATKVDWAVYCPVLPRGWFVGSGQWRLADGGRLEISYRGPDGAGLMLQEGAFCPGEGDCVPEGTEVGTTAFGDREGTLLQVDGGWAVTVDRGSRPSWLLVLTGVDEALARSIAADLFRVVG